MSITQITKHLKPVLKKLSKYLFFVLGGWLMAWILLARKKADEEITRAENEEKKRLNYMSDSDVVDELNNPDIQQARNDARDRVFAAYRRSRDRLSEHNRKANSKLLKRTKAARERLYKKYPDSNNGSSGNSGPPAPDPNNGTK